jgi:hypothetical protein
VNDTSRIAKTEHGFDLIRVRSSDSPGGETLVPFEYTACPDLVIVPMGIDEQQRGAFGVWRLVHVENGLAVPIPRPHDEDVDRVRWFAAELAKLDVDWNADRETLNRTVGVPMQHLIAQADKDDQLSTPPGYLPRSVLRLMSKHNARIDAKEA